MPSFETFKKWVKADWEAHSDWRGDARENFAFVAGDQWTDEEKEELKAKARVPIVFNRTATIINSVAGSEINGRTEVRYFPRTLGDAELNEVLTKGAEWYRDQSMAEEEESQAFYDCLVCGLGWTESILDFDADEDGEPRMERIDPLEMCWDSTARRRGLLDAKRIARVRDISLDEAKDMFPDADVTDLDASWLDKGTDGEKPTHQWSDDDYKHEGDEDDLDDDDEVTIVQLQYRQRRTLIEYKDPMTGKVGRMGKTEWKRLQEMSRQMGFDMQMRFREVSAWEWRQVVLGNDILLENDPCAVSSTYVPITGYWDNAAHEWYGLLRQMRDPQKYANKWLSQQMHILNSNAKGGIMVEEGATDDPAKLEEDWAASDSVVWLRDGAISRNQVMPKPVVQMPPALMSLTEFAIMSIRDVSGVNQELLGLRDQNQPGVLEYQRKQAAMTTLAVLFDALRQYRKQQGRVMLYYMTEYMADGRLIRIADEEGERYEPLVLPDGATKFDVIVDDAPTSPNNKERVWEIIMSLMPVLAQAGLPNEVWGEIIEYAPFPAALIEKLKEHANKPKQPDPMQQAMMQELLAKIESEKAKAKKDEANAFENMAQGHLALTKAQAEPAMAQSEVQKDVMQAQAARFKASADVHKSNAAIHKANMDLEGKRMDIEAKRNEARKTDG